MENGQAVMVPKEKIDQKTVEDFLFSTGTKLDDQQKKLFFALSIRNQLAPAVREIVHVLGVGRREPLRVEHVEVGEVPHRQRAPPDKPEHACRERGQLAHRLGQREQTSRSVPVREEVGRHVGVADLARVGASVGESGVHPVDGKQLRRQVVTSVEEPCVEQLPAVALEQPVDDELDWMDVQGGRVLCHGHPPILAIVGEIAIAEW